MFAFNRTARFKKDCIVREDGIIFQNFDAMIRMPPELCFSGGMRMATLPGAGTVLETVVELELSSRSTACLKNWTNAATLHSACLGHAVAKASVMCLLGVPRLPASVLFLVLILLETALAWQILFFSSSFH